MTSLKNLSDDQLHQSAIAAARRDQAATLVTLEHLEEVASRYLHAKRGYSSLQDYAENALGFSGPAAAERIAAMRLTVAVPETKEKLKSGELSFSSAVAVQRFICREEKARERRFTPEQKQDMVREVSGRSVDDTKRALLAFAVSPEPHLFRESIRPVTPSRTEFCFYANSEFSGELGRVKELKGGLSLEEIFTAALSVYLDRIDPTRKKGKVIQAVAHLESPEAREGESGNQTPLSEIHEKPVSMVEGDNQSIRTSESGTGLDSRYVRVSDQRALQARSGGRCEYVDPKSGRRCESRSRIQTDHQIPWALGGVTELVNLRHYCPAHNTLAAVEAFGMRKMKRYLRI